MCQYTWIRERNGVFSTSEQAEVDDWEALPKRGQNMKERLLAEWKLVVFFFVNCRGSVIGWIYSYYPLYNIFILGLVIATVIIMDFSF